MVQPYKRRRGFISPILHPPQKNPRIHTNIEFKFNSVDCPRPISPFWKRPFMNNKKNKFINQSINILILRVKRK